MNNQDKFNRFVERHPHPHHNFFERPHASRREFFRIAGAGLTGSLLAAQNLGAQSVVVKNQGMVTQNKAKNVIFILLTGAISHVDSFDFKNFNGVTPSNFNPAVKNGINWPTGIMPKLFDAIPDMCIVRSVRSWALVHSLAQHWAQIGRSPVAALGPIAPNMGSIVAVEKQEKDKIFPTFVALNANSAISSGYLPSTYSPFYVTADPNGLADTTNALGQQRFETMFQRLDSLDGSLRRNSPFGKAPEDYDGFYKSAKGMMYTDLTRAFSFTTADSARYGTNAFGNACLVAKQVLAADQGTHYIQINHGSWDMHDDIYGATSPTGANMYTFGRVLDNGLSELLKDLKSAGLFDKTLVVLMSEFGRTVGPVSSSGGRDHYLQQFAMFAGAGVRGGRAIGATKSDGSSTETYGWSRNRDVRVEDIEATMQSALGIDWTSVRYDDPFGRGYEYTPFSDQDLYGPINEIWM